MVARNPLGFLPGSLPTVMMQSKPESSVPGMSESRTDLLATVAGLPAHPFLFALATIMATLGEVKFGLLWQESLPALTILEIIIAVVFACCLLLAKDRHKAGLASSSFLAWFVLYRVALEGTVMVSRSVLSAPLPAWLFLLVYCVLGVAGLLVLLKDRWTFKEKTVTIQHQSATGSLNLVSLIMIVFSLLPLYFFYSELEQLSAQMQTEMRAELKLSGIVAARKPDIYYIMADGFPGSQTLHEFWRYDNTPFIDFLKARRFCVVEKSASNYDRTFFSLASTMNMQYLHDPVGFYKKHPGHMYAYDWLSQHNSVMRLLKQLGYRLINVSSGDGSTRDMPDADLNIAASPVNMFTAAFLQLTPIFTLESYFHMIRDQLIRVELAPGERLPEIVKMDSPKFVLIHSMLSHQPYIFDDRGNPLPLDPALQNQAGNPESFLKQLKFTESQLEKWIDIILSSAKEPPVIMLQSDHGPQFATDTISEFYNEHMRNLGAYLVPGCDRPPDQSMTNVNSFRQLFNCYFQANLPPLPNKAFCAANADDFDLKEVYSQLDFSHGDKGWHFKTMPNKGEIINLLHASKPGF